MLLLVILCLILWGKYIHHLPTTSTISLNPGRSSIASMQISIILHTVRELLWMSLKKQLLRESVLYQIATKMSLKIFIFSILSFSYIYTVFNPGTNWSPQNGLSYQGFENLFLNVCN